MLHVIPPFFLHTVFQRSRTLLLPHFCEFFKYSHHALARLSMINRFHLISLSELYSWQVTNQSLY